MSIDLWPGEDTANLYGKGFLVGTTIDAIIKAENLPRHDESFENALTLTWENMKRAGRESIVFPVPNLPKPEIEIGGLQLGEVPEPIGVSKGG